MTETEFQQQVTDLAELYGWSWVHFRPAQTAKGWRTPVSGPLGKGWVDLVLVRERDKRVIFAELKGENGRVSEEQRVVLETLARATPSGEVYVWRPSRFDQIERILRRRGAPDPLVVA